MKNQQPWNVLPMILPHAMQIEKLILETASALTESH